MATAKLRDDIIKPAVRSWESPEKYVVTFAKCGGVRMESLTEIARITSYPRKPGEAIAATDKDYFLVLRGVRDIVAFLAQWSLGTVFFCGRSVHG
jgi:hypothetical protein